MLGQAVDLCAALAQANRPPNSSVMPVTRFWIVLSSLRLNSERRTIVYVPQASGANQSKAETQLCVDCSQERQDREANVAAAVQEEQILEELREKAVRFTMYYHESTS